MQMLHAHHNQTLLSDSATCCLHSDTTAAVTPSLTFVEFTLSCRHDVNEIIVGTMQNSILRFPIDDAGDEDPDSSTVP